jgi:outer membrane protein assembly factor BamA
MENTIVVNDKKGAPEEAEDILKQQPNPGFWIVTPHFGFYVAPGLGLYNWGNNTDSNFFSRIGSAPVILDTAKVARGAIQLQNWYFNKGYFNASSSYQIDSLRKKSQKAEVTYRVNTGERYYINALSKEVGTKKIENLINYITQKDSVLKKGDAYDGDKLEVERQRIAQFLRNEGFYNFSKNFITFSVDTLLPGNLVNVKMIVSQRQVDVGDTVAYRDHQEYRINNIYIRPDLDLKKFDTPEDSLQYKDYTYVYDTLQYNPRYISDAIHFKSGSRYDEQDVKDTYSHLVGYKAFRLTQINFEPAKNDSTGPLLNAYVNLTPLDKRTLILEPELTFNSTPRPGVNGSVGWIDRNVFGGGEALEIRFNAGLQFYPSADSTVSGTDATRTLELGGEVSLDFPRWLLPFNTEGLFPKRMQPKSRATVYYNFLERIEFDRNTFGSKLSYSIRESRRKAHTFDMVDLTYSRVSAINNQFLQALSDIQRRAFTSEFISTIRYTYIINEQLDNKWANPRYLKAVVEPAGYILGKIDDWTRVGETLDNGSRSIFNVQYFQYLKFEVDGRYLWNLGKRRAWVNRLYSGYIYPYGNSKIATDTGVARIPPFSKYFYMGGSNDLRAWTPYRLGAGTTPNTNYSEGQSLGFATGTFKLLFNSEYRFPIFSLLQGAVFIDAGNVWYSGGLETDNTDIQVEDLLNEFAIGTGFGLRLDFDFFVVRFDIGVKVRDPGLLSQNDEWVILTRNIPRNLTYNIALGYPF